MKTVHRLFVGLLALVAAQALAQNTYVRENFTKTEVQIPMRDGVKLWTCIYAPKAEGPAAPFLMMRTPYSCRPYGADTFRDSLGPESNFTRERMIFVYQDVRGRYMSEGGFQWMTPYIPNKKAGQVDESTDTWDTIEWLLKNVPNHNGRLGVYGTSFPGHYAAQTLIDPHPALKAVSPQAPMADNWMGDDMHHNGAFFLPHAMGFIAGFGKKRVGPTQDYGPRVFNMGTQDGYKFYLEMGPIANSLTKYNMNQIELWKEWLAHPDYDAYWQAQNVPQHLKKCGNVAVLLVGGWWDAEDLQGPLKIHEAIERFNKPNNTTIVMGPWYHGSWNGGPGTSLHDILWQTRTGDDFRARVQLPFFKKHLLEEGDPEIPEALMFDTGADTWRTFAKWPPTGLTSKSLYLAKGGKLSFSAPSQAKGVFQEYLSDPNKPAPVSNLISTGMPRQYMIEDQRFAERRPDVLTYQTAPLQADTTLAGPLKATLYVSTTGTDADFIVKLIDVFPNDYGVRSPRDESYPMGGYQMLVRGEPMRAKYRKSWSKPVAMAPGKVETVAFALPDVCYTFKKGHRIMVQVQSSWFPVVDRNPQTFVDIMKAKASDFKKATHRVYLSGSTASRLTVGVLNSGSELVSTAITRLFDGTGLQFTLPNGLDRRIPVMQFPPGLTLESKLQRIMRIANLTYRTHGGNYVFVERERDPNLHS